MWPWQVTMVMLEWFVRVPMITLRWTLSTSDDAPLNLVTTLFTDFLHLLLSLDPAIVRELQEPIISAPTGYVRRDNFYAKWYGEAPLNDNALHVLLYAHGGGFCCGSVQTAQAYVPDVTDMTTAGTATRVFSVDYSLTPEARCPTQLNEFVAAFDYLIDELHIPARRIILMGCSAGGNLALAACQTLRDRGKPLPAAMILISPYIDLAANRPSMIVNQRYDFPPDKWLRQTIPNYYLPDGMERSDATASPLNGDMLSLPPMLVSAGGHEMMIDEINALIDKARTANVEVTEFIEPNMVHAFPEIPFVGKPYHTFHKRLVQFALDIFQRA